MYENIYYCDICPFISNWASLLSRGTKTTIGEPQTAMINVSVSLDCFNINFVMSANHIIASDC